ncbi:nlpC/P60 family protein [Chlamydia ibidis]|uniref:NlpC/P60 family protein n=2 Tax=Chlamydia ibidis TaxID=1405396 RepID=S7J3W1_9CHLA|nr:NlpC/P60 family protein [Chlamydia ibidis]EPP35109.1 nlpC/P60 family protein [Chlamydia ibidis]EQM62684.1 nlpC/P60 family protein [Chlamydia ibidis 10-1398/6]
MTYYYLSSSVVDLRSIAGELETQLLFGERLICSTSKCFAYSQLTYNRGTWQPYPIDIFPENSSFSILSSPLIPNAVVHSFNAILEPWGIPLPYGTPLTIDKQGHVSLPREMLALFPTNSNKKSFCDPRHYSFLSSQKNSLHSLIKTSEKFLGIPYLWGGRCIHDNLNLGTDCSGFINILFQAHGMNIPRNARDQYHDCLFMDNFNDLPLGGLVFLKSRTSDQISHVMLKQSSKSIVHAVQSLGRVVKSIIGADCEFAGNMFYFGNKWNIASYGVPKKRRAFF